MSRTDGTGSAIVGIGSSAFYKRGTSWPKSVPQLGAEAIVAAVEDAGLDIKQVDGFVYFSGAGSPPLDNAIETATLMEMLGIPDVGFSTAVSGGGGGSAAAVGLAALGIASGEANYVVVIFGLQMHMARAGQIFGSSPNTAQNAFHKPHGFVGTGHFMALMARRHMHLYGTRREAFAEVAISTRRNAMTQPGAMRTEPMTLDDYFNARMIADPLCLFDFCIETDGAVAVVVTSEERARDARHRPARIVSAVHGGTRGWGRAFMWGNQQDDMYASGGNRPIAEKLFARAGVAPGDVDVALLYDHFTPLVIMQLEDYGFCARGEGGPFVESGAIRFEGGTIPTNPDGGHLSSFYAVGMTHITEAVRQIRGTAANQVADAELALVTGGPAPVPVSGLLLGR